MQPFATGGLAEGHQADSFQSLLQLLGGLDDPVECNVGRRIEGEHQPTGDCGMAGLVIPRVIFNRRNLCRSDEAGDTIDLKIRLVVPGDFHQPEEARRPRHRMPLEKTLRVDAIRRANYRAWSPFQMLDHPGTDLLEVAREVYFRVRLELAVRGPQRLVGIGDDDAEHDVIGGSHSWGSRPRVPGCKGFQLLRSKYRLGMHLLGGLVLAQAFEGCLP